jgi:hypothetical protein
MGRNVRRWYGVSINGQVLFHGTETEVSDFRNTCHQFFRKLHRQEHRHYFPYSDGQRRHGTCNNRAAFQSLTSQILMFEKRGCEVWLVDRNEASQEARVHP